MREGAQGRGPSATPMTGPGGFGHTSATMRNLAIPVLLALLLGCSSDSDLGEEWTAITEEDFPLVFAPPGLEDAIGRYLRTVRYEQGRPILNTWAGLTSPGTRLPQAEMNLEQVGPAFVITLDAKDALSRAVDRAFEGSLPTLLAKGRDVNLLGAIDYVHVLDTEADCLLFIQTWRRERILNILQGRYCVAAEPGLREALIKTVLRGIKEK